MTCVEVKHKPSHTKRWWFAVPEFAKNNISTGDSVICDTRKGKNNGVVCAVARDISSKFAMHLSNGHKLRNIVGIERSINVDELSIPKSIQEFGINQEKVEKQIELFQEIGMFKTRIVANKHNVLIDGFSAYEAAKRLGVKTLKCLQKLY